MNRRKLFGFLAAAPAAVAAESGFVTVAHQGDIVPGKPKKWYSMLDYRVVRRAWRDEYLRKKNGLDCGSREVHPTNLFSAGVSDGYINESGVWTYLRGLTTSSELNQAFADACINGEVPGVWWE